MSRRSVISWILSSLIMFGVSYVWHGIFLNDITYLNYPVSIYLVSSSIVYLLVGFVLVKVFSMEMAAKLIPGLFIRGVICGAVLGMILYMIALVLGVTFEKNISLANILVDVPWQMFEQAVGGLVVGTVFTLIYEPQPFRPEDHV